MQSDQIGRNAKGNNIENSIKIIIKSECPKIVLDKKEAFALFQGWLIRGSWNNENLH